MNGRIARVLVTLAVITALFGISLPSLASGSTRNEIDVDGTTDDWNGILPAIIDATGDNIPSGSTGDIGSVYVTDNGLNLYFRIDANQLNLDTPVHIDIDADRNSATGYNANTDTLGKFASHTHDVGVDFSIGLNDDLGTGTCALYDWRTMPPTSIQTGLAFMRNATPGTLVEMAMPLNLIDITTYPLPWNIVFRTSNSPSGTPNDEAPNTGFLAYPLASTPTPTPVPPAVVTDNATGIDTTSATLNGNLTSLGSAATVNVAFEWGLTPSYTEITELQSLNSHGPFSASLSSVLSPDTTYHFRARATSISEGSPVYGEDMTFRTLELPVVIPPSVVTDAASGVTQTSATLNGNLTSLGSATIASVSFEWGLNATYGNTTVPVPMNNTGVFSCVLPIVLTANTTYHYRAKAIGDGTRYGDDATVMTLRDSPITKEWTFMVYMAADNSLGYQGFDISDLNEMKIAGSTGQTNVVVLDDGYGANNTFLYYVENGNLTNAPNNPFGPEVDMGIPVTLETFIGWAQTNYPANHYAIVLWNHGNGWRTFSLAKTETTRYVCSDDTSGTHLSLSDIRSALTATTFPLELIGFDACMMQMVETAYELHSVLPGGVMVGSEENVPGDGWPYDTVLANLNANPTQNATTFGNSIVADYMAEYSGIDWVTMSAVNLLNMNDLNSAIDDFAASLKSSNEHTNITAAIMATDTFFDGDYIDLYELADQIQTHVTNQELQSAAAGVKTAITTMVSNSGAGSGHTDAHGISIYLPRTSYSNDYNNLTFAEQHNWDEFLKWYLNPVSVTTDTASNITGISAVLNANLTDMGTANPVQVCFEWGDTPLITNTTTVQNMTVAGTFNATMNGLSDNTTYYFRAKATGGDVTNFGETSSFTMMPLVNVDISVVLQGGSRPDSGWAIPITVKFFTPGADVMIDTPSHAYYLTTMKSGSTAICQCVGVEPGVYDISAVSEHTLVSVKRSVTISVSSVAVPLGTLLEGNANNDIRINALDFGILSVAYLKNSGNPGFDARADFDRSGRINALDFGLLSANYLRVSPIEVP